MHSEVGPRLEVHERYKVLINANSWMMGLCPGQVMLSSVNKWKNKKKIGFIPYTYSTISDFIVFIDIVYDLKSRIFKV